jgi:ribonuclease HI
MIQEDEAMAKAEAERPRPSLTIFTDRSPLDSGAAGYSVVWQNGHRWAGLRTHMGYNQEAYDAECSALARALETATRRQTAPERVTIFTDAQVAIKRMASEEPSPSQMTRSSHIAALRRAWPGIIIEIRWCPAHKGVPGSEKADEWAKLAAEEPDAQGVEWLRYSARAGARPMPHPRALAHLKREISEKKWARSPPMGWRPGH